MQFARLLKVSITTPQKWETARREPTRPAEALLRIVENEPAAAMAALMHTEFRIRHRAIRKQYLPNQCRVTGFI